MHQNILYNFNEMNSKYRVKLELVEYKHIEPSRWGAYNVNFWLFPC
jgi:hypothetical protein